MTEVDCVRPLHENLNEQQHKAVHLNTGSYLMAACAGAGKTKVITLRIENLIATGVDPQKIGAFTFTRDAAKEMQKRGEALGYPENMRIGTLHSLCYEILRQDGAELGGNFAIDDKNQIYYMMKDLMSRNFRGVGLDPKAAQTLMGLAKADCLSMHPVNSGEDGNAILVLFKAKADKTWLARAYRDLFEQLEAAKRAKGLIDFDDQLYLAWKLLVTNSEVRDRWVNRFDYFLIDEAQDSSSVQNAVASILAESSKNIMMIGDVVQSIYSWRGAKPYEFVGFGKKFEVHRLPVNYRSTVEICRYASNLTKDADWNITGPTLAHPGAASDIASADAVEYLSPEDEAEGIANEIVDLQSEGVKLGNIAILYRVVNLLQPIETALLNNNIPYVVWSGATFYDRKEVKDVMAYMYTAAMRDPTEFHVKRGLNVPFRYIGRVFIEAVEDVALANNCAFLDALQQYKSARENQNANAARYVKLLFTLNKMYSENRKPADLISFVLQETKYLQTLKMEEGEDGPDPDSGKATHVHQLLKIAESFKTTDQFLDYVVKMEQILKSSRKKRNPDAVVCSSIHKFKGLERDFIFSPGWNEGVLPHARNPDPDEELRLAYVCLTRAAKRFQCSWTMDQVTTAGQVAGAPSRFIRKSGMPVRRIPAGVQKVKVKQKELCTCNHWAVDASDITPCFATEHPRD